MTDVAHRSPGRFDALDTLRWIAVLVMVQGHSFYVTLADSARSTAWYSWHNYLHGYTAPAFLFGAGLAFGFTTLSERISDHARWGPVLAKRLYRYGSLLAIGYAIQLPPLAMATRLWSEGSVRVFLRVEALQHIAVALLLSQLLVVVLRRKGAVVAACAAIGSFIVLAGPAASRVPVEAWGSPAVAAFMSGESGSTFPLVPWAGFVMAGVVIGAGLHPVRQRFAAHWVALGFVVGGGCLVALSLWLDVAAPGLFGEHRYWKVSPYFFVRRLGWVLAALGGLAAFDVALQAIGSGGQPGALRRWIRTISQQSLVAYVGHLVILYGSPFSPGLKVLLNRNLGPLGSAVVVVALLIALEGLLRTWKWLERRHELAFFRFRRASVAVMVVASLTAAVRTAGYPLGENLQVAGARPTGGVIGAAPPGPALSSPGDHSASAPRVIASATSESASQRPAVR